MKSLIIHFTFSLFCLIIFQSSIVGQGWLKIVKNPDWWKVDAVSQTPDGGFFIAGLRANEWEVFVAKTDSAGNFLWEKTYLAELARPGLTAIGATPDGGCVLAGVLDCWNTDTTENLFLMRLEPNGDVRWETHFSFPGGKSDYLLDMLLNPDGTILVAGNEHGVTGALSLFSTDGSVLWAKKFEDFRIQKVLRVPGGWVLTCRDPRYPSRWYPRMASVGRDGNLLWKDKLAADGRYDFDEVIRTADGGFAFLASFDPHPFIIDPAESGPGIMKTDSAFNLLWFKEFTFEHDLRYGKLHQASNGDLLLVGYETVETNGENCPIFLTRLTREGEIIWTKPLFPFYFYAHTIPASTATSDGGILLAGQLEPDVPGGNFEDFYLVRFDQRGWLTPSVFSGRLFFDENSNCQFDIGESGLGGWLLRAEGQAGTFYGTSDENGRYEIGVDPGAYRLEALVPGGLWQLCPGTYFSAAEYHVLERDIAAQPFALCPAMTVEVSANRFRRCTGAVVSANWCNFGTVQAQEAWLEIELDEMMSFVNSNHPVEQTNNGLLRFPLGTVEPNQCGGIRFTAKVDCDAEIGLSVCIRARVVVTEECPPPLAATHISTAAICEHETVKLTIENDGTAGMNRPMIYEVIENYTLDYSGQFQLKKGEQYHVLRPANGHTWRIQTRTVEGDLASASGVEACVFSESLPVTVGYFSLFPLVEDISSEDLFCDEITGSFDPNDKQSFPKGYGHARFIEANTPVEYRIRFQNTGNDTAFSVVVVDTLPALLDPSGFRPGASSHPYTWKLSDVGILEFRFPGIQLLDSVHHEPESHGFVSFKISQKKDLEPGTVIRNSAAIYFDENPPVITEETYVTIGKDFLLKKSNGENTLQSDVKVLPNPFTSTTRFMVTGENIGVLDLKIYDLYGRLVRSERHHEGSFSFHQGELPAGCWIFELASGGKHIGTGRFVVVDF